MIHEIKTWTEFFDDVATGRKPFEVRKNDRPYAVGDYLAHNEFEPGIGYTGRCAFQRIVYKMNDVRFCLPDYVILGVIPCRIQERETTGPIGKTQKRDECSDCWCNTCGRFESCIIADDRWSKESKPCPCDACYQDKKAYRPKSGPICPDYLQGKKEKNCEVLPEKENCK